MTAVFTGCATAPPPAPAADAGLLQTRLAVQQKYSQEAADLRAAGRLYQALQSLRVLDAVSPDLPGLRARMDAVQLEIEARVLELTDGARWAFEHGSTDQGMALLLRALSLRPSDEGLRRQISDRYRRIAESRIAGKPTEQLARQPVEVPTDEVTAYNQTTTDANGVFEQGLALYDSDPERARELFRQALEIDPTHIGARAYLDTMVGQ